MTLSEHEIIGWPSKRSVKDGFSLIPHLSNLKSLLVVVVGSGGSAVAKIVEKKLQYKRLEWHINLDYNVNFEVVEE